MVEVNFYIRVRDDLKEGTEDVEVGLTESATSWHLLNQEGESAVDEVLKRSVILVSCSCEISDKSDDGWEPERIVLTNLFQSCFKALTDHVYYHFLKRWTLSFNQASFQIIQVFSWRCRINKQIVHTDGFNSVWMLLAQEHIWRHAHEIENLDDWVIFLHSIMLDGTF